MAISYDPPKNERNIRHRGLSFELVRDMDWRTVLVGPAKTQELTTTRWHAIGMIGAKLNVCIFAFADAGIRVISLRRAQKKEERQWQSVRTLK